MKENFYKQCFPTLQDLLKTLQDVSHPSSRTKAVEYDGKEIQSYLQTNSPATHPQYCQLMAIAVLEAKTPLANDVNKHLSHNYEYYHKGTLEKFPDKEVLAVRTEHLWDDIEKLDKATGGQGVFTHAGKVKNENIQTQETKIDPTAEQLRDLCCILWEDIETYQKIVNRARNLDYQSKLQTSQDVWSTCGVNFKEREEFKVEDNRTTTSNALAKEENGKIITFSWYKWHDKKCPTLKLIAD